MDAKTRNATTPMSAETIGIKKVGIVGAGQMGNGNHYTGTFSHANKYQNTKAYQNTNSNHYPRAFSHTDEHQNTKADQYHYAYSDNNIDAVLYANS